MINYVKNKIKSKIEAHLRMMGKKEEFDKVLIDNLIKNFEGFGKYQIIWKDSLPNRIKKIPDDSKIEVMMGKYYIVDGGYSQQLFSSEYIEFSLQEERDYKISKLVK